MRSPWWRSGQCGLTRAQFAMQRGREGRGAQGRAIGEVSGERCGGEWDHASSTELLAARVLSRLLRREANESGAGEVSEQGTRQRCHGTLEATPAWPASPRPVYVCQMASVAWAGRPLTLSTTAIRSPPRCLIAWLWQWLTPNLARYSERCS
jgi:hypothetical protein